MAGTSSSVSRRTHHRTRPGGHRLRLLVFGIILSLLALILLLLDPLAQRDVEVAAFGSGLAFALFAYSEARSWHDPLTEGHGLVLVLWSGVAFPAYLATTTHRRPLWITILLIFLLAVNVVVGVAAAIRF